MTMIDDIQARLDSLKTNKQRKQRMKELHRIFQARGGTADLEFAIEQGALMIRLETQHIMTAKEAADYLYEGAASGNVPLYVDTGDEQKRIPPEVFKLPH